MLLPDLPGTVRKRPIPMPRALPLPLVLPGGPGSLAVSEMGVVASKALPDCSSTVNCACIVNQRVVKETEPKGNQNFKTISTNLALNRTHHEPELDNILRSWVNW